MPREIAVKFNVKLKAKSQVQGQNFHTFPGNSHISRNFHTFKFNLTPPTCLFTPSTCSHPIHEHTCMPYIL